MRNENWIVDFIIEYENLLDGYLPRRIVTFIHVEDQQLIEPGGDECRGIHPLDLAQFWIVTKIKRVTGHPRRLIASSLSADDFESFLFTVAVIASQLEAADVSIVSDDAQRVGSSQIDTMNHSGEFHLPAAHRWRNDGLP